MNKRGSLGHDNYQDSQLSRYEPRGWGAQTDRTDLKLHFLPAGGRDQDAVTRAQTVRARDGQQLGGGLLLCSATHTVSQPRAAQVGRTEYWLVARHM